MKVHEVRFKVQEFGSEVQEFGPEVRVPNAEPHLEPLNPTS